jgi:hypothetical protein
MPSAGFETAIPATKRPHNYALDPSAIGIGKFGTYQDSISARLRDFLNKEIHICETSMAASMKAFCDTAPRSTSTRLHGAIPQKANI